jgi:hypothetical protein
MPLPLTSHEALRLTASFAFTAERMRAADEASEIRANICETASRVAFLISNRLAEREAILPLLGQTFRRPSFSIA